MDTARIEIISDICLTSELLGIQLPSVVQAFRVRLDKNQSVSDNHFVVCAYLPPLDQHICELIAEQLCEPSTFDCISFITEDAEGKAAVISGLGHNTASPFEVAAAVAMVKASCGWDESHPILITANGVELAIYMHFDENGWSASWAGN